MQGLPCSGKLVHKTNVNMNSHFYLFLLQNYYVHGHISLLTVPVKNVKRTSTSFFISCRRFSHTQSKLLWSAVAHRENTGLEIERTRARIPFANPWHFRSLSCISEYLAIDGGGNVSEWHRCQHQRTKKRERVDEKAGVRMFSPPPGGATEYIAYRSVRHMDFARATITLDIFIPSPTQCGLSRSLTNRQNT